MPAEKSATGPAKKVDPRLAEAQRRAKALTGGGGKRPKNSQEAWAQFVQSLKDHWSELKKTTWPSQDVLRKSTMVVLAFVAGVAAWVGSIDFILTKVETLIPGGLH